MGKNDVPEVGLLDSDNWWEWAVRMEDLLIYKELSDCLDVDGETLTNAAAKSADRKALALLRSHVSSPLLPYLQGKKSAKSVWDALQSLYATNLDARKDLLEDQLQQLQKAKTEDVTEYVARAQKVRLELTSAGEQVSDQRLMRAILRGLPDEFETIREILLAQTNVQLADAMSRLRVAEERIGRSEGSGATALAASKKKRDMSKIRCYNCQQFGHFKRDCKKPPRNNQKSKPVDTVAMSAVEAAGGLEHCGGVNAPDDAVAMSVAKQVAAGGEDTAWRSIDWVVDTGATQHILADRYEHAARDIVHSNTMVTLVDGSRVKAKGQGVVKLMTSTRRGDVEITLADVLIVPGAPYNLLSWKQMKAHGVQMTSAGEQLLLKRHKKIIGEAKEGADGLPTLECEFEAKLSVKALAAGKGSAELWHARLGHLSYSTMARMVRNGTVQGLEVSERELKSKTEEACDVCIKAKHTAASHPASDTRASRPLELVHSDLMGQFKPISAGGNQFLLTATDDYSGFAAVRPLKHKSEASDAFKKILLAWERQLDSRVKCVRTDRGEEYAAFNKWCDEQGIQRERSAAYKPQQNGRAERLNRTLTEKTRAMLLQSSIPKKFWAEAFSTATQLYNVAPRFKQSKSPHELFHDKKPEVQDLRTFGCKAYCLMTPPKKTKLGERTETGRLLGAEPGSKGWRILLDGGGVVVRRDVKFVEAVEDHRTTSHLIDDEVESAASQAAGENDRAAQAGAADGHNFEDAADDSVAGEQADGGAEELREATGAGEQSEKVPARDANPADAPKRTLPPRLREPSKRAFKDAYALMAQVETPDEPATLEAALQQPDGELWQQAADDEMKSLQELDVFDAVDKPAGPVKLLKNKWVLKRKRTKQGLIERYKARLVAKGFLQAKGIDYEEVFAPVARHATLRALLAVAAAYDLELEQIDVKTAFLNGDLQEDIYMEPPACYDFGGKVLKLKKALYGLKQAARAWNQKLVSVLTAQGFEVSVADASLFTLTRDGRQAFLLIYVDDGLIVGTQEDVENIIKVLEVFELRKLGPAAYFLGMEIVRDREARTLLLSQQKYTEQILQEAGMQDCKPRSIPMEVNTRLSKEGVDYMEDKAAYCNKLGQVLYLCSGTRPDIAYAVGVLARFAASPREEHWRKLKGVLQYLRHTAHRGLMFGGDTELKLEGYSDADYAADPDKRRSTGGYVFMLAHGAISWASKLLATVAASTMEAEYMAAAWAAKEALWLRKLLTTLMGAEGATVMELQRL